VLPDPGGLLPVGGGRNPLSRALLGHAATLADLPQASQRLLACRFVVIAGELPLLFQALGWDAAAVPAADLPGDADIDEFDDTTIRCGAPRWGRKQRENGGSTWR
jgi:hypothetical protein